MSLAVSDSQFPEQVPSDGCRIAQWSVPEASRPKGLYRPDWRLSVTVLAAASLLCWLACQMPGPQWLLSQQADLGALQQQHPVAFAACFFFVFTLLSALALPGCGVLAVAAGVYFGLAAGTALVLLASTIGASVSFLAARHLLRDPMQRRFGHRLQAIENGLARDGAFYLFSLRVAPLIPYAVINPLMGLSRMPLSQFFGTSLLGMLAGSAVYVYAGTALASVPLASVGWSALFSPALLAALLALAVLPWGMRAAWRTVSPRMIAPQAPQPCGLEKAS